MSGLDAAAVDRYARHLVVDEIGPEGQATLLDGTVIVVGAGGLGSPVVQYLAAAGVGTLRIVDDDAVERSNLQRQVIHADADPGESKVESARRYVERLNPDVTVEAVETRFAPDNAGDLLDEADVAVDAADNVPTRYLLNDAARLREVPVAHGAVTRFEGQATTLVPGGPCYRCLFPEAPDLEAVPDCSRAGVVGAVPGAIGSLQAAETVKLLLGEGEPLAGRLLYYDALEAGVETVTYDRSPASPTGGEGGIDTIEEVEYDGSCGVDAD